MAFLKQTKEKTMVKIEIDYEGELRCHSVHISSGGSLTTDAPLDNQGRGEGFFSHRSRCHRVWDLHGDDYGDCCQVEKDESLRFETFGDQGDV